MTPHLYPIDIPQERKRVVSSVNELKRRYALSLFLQAYFMKLPAKKMTAALATKLHLELTEHAHSLVAVLVTYGNPTKLPDGGMEANLTVHLHGMAPITYRMRQRADLTFDTSVMFNDDAHLEGDIEHLDSVLRVFAHRAKRYNELLEGLREIAETAVNSNGVVVEPLGEMFGAHIVNAPAQDDTPLVPLFAGLQQTPRNACTTESESVPGADADKPAQ